jgi:hypothetical protein
LFEGVSSGMMPQWGQTMRLAVVGSLYVLTVLSACALESDANPLDDCTLKNMVGVKSDTAAKFIREACLGQISSNIPTDKLTIESNGSIGQDRYNSSSNALYLHLQNKTPYAITELVVRITTANGSKQNDYRVTNFLEIYTGSGMVIGLPPDPASYLQVKPFSTAYFSFPIREPVPGKNDKWGFQIISASGYLATE